MIGDRLDTDIAFAANCGLAHSVAVLSGVTSEQEIKEYARFIEENDLGNENAKCVPDFYASSLGEFEEFIRDHSD
jgi:ribonucleotide monophosphatase NagD (HAD superfamily)